MRIPSDVLDSPLIKATDTRLDGKDHGGRVSLVLACSGSSDPSDSNDPDDAGSRSERTAPLFLLVAEPNSVQQIVAVNTLQKAGFVVDLAVNGVEVLEAVQQKRYDLIFMDCNLPQMSGFTATLHIRRLETGGTLPGRSGSGGSRLPIIAMTANTMPDYRAECLRVGMDDHVGKPFQRGDLVRKVGQFCRHTRRGG